MFCWLFPSLCKSLLVSCSPICLFFLLFLLLEETYPKKILLRPMSKRVQLIFSSRSFMTSGLTFKSLIHFKFIFVYGVRRWSRVILLHVAVQFSQYHLLKRLYFPLIYYCLLCCRWIDHLSMGLFPCCLFYCIDLCVCFLCQYQSMLWSCFTLNNSNLFWNLEWKGLWPQDHM